MTFAALSLIVLIQAAATGPVAAHPQTTPPATADAAPPVLSTVPIPPAGAQPQPGSMSGLPLQVGDLPPGTVAIRVVRQPFTNVVGQAVELRVGADGRPRTATTGADGRAQFTGLAVGEHVMAVAIVDGERLESQLFQLPSRGGVRVLLLAGEGRGGDPGIAAGSAGANPVASGGETQASATSATALWLGAVFAATALAVGWSATRRRPSSPVAPPPAAPTPGPSRAALLAERDRLHAELERVRAALGDTTGSDA